MQLRESVRLCLALLQTCQQLASALESLDLEVDRHGIVVHGIALVGQVLA